MQKYHALVITEQQLIRQGLATLVAKSPIIATVSEHSALNQSKQLTGIDLLIIGDTAHMALDFIGCPALKLRLEYLPTLIICASREINRKFCIRDTDHAPYGYLSSNANTQEMLMAIAELSTHIALSSKRSLSNQYRVTKPASLTNRQEQVLRLLSQGKSNKLIAQELNMAANTVRNHVSAILAAMGVQNRTQAGILAKQYMVVSDSIRFNL